MGNGKGYLCVIVCDKNIKNAAGNDCDSLIVTTNMLLVKSVNKSCPACNRKCSCLSYMMYVRDIHIPSKNIVGPLSTP